MEPNETRELIQKVNGALEEEVFDFDEETNEVYMVEDGTLVCEVEDDWNKAKVIEAIQQDLQKRIDSFNEYARDILYARWKLEK